ncbi:MAG: protease, partial [Bacteroidales bacterium]|nr:protease [Bacteroidales bacterium]
MKLNQIFFFVIIGILIHINYQLLAQISQGGFPPSFNQVLLSEDFQEINLTKPDMKSILEEDKLNEDKFNPYRIAVTIDVDININNSGTWTKLVEGGRIWRLKIKCKDALALGVYYDKFYLPKGSKLFLYNEDKTQVIGAFTSFNNNETGIFAT